MLGRRLLVIQCHSAHRSHGPERGSLPHQGRHRHICKFCSEQWTSHGLFLSCDFRVDMSLRKVTANRNEVNWQAPRCSSLSLGAVVRCRRWRRCVMLFREGFCLSRNARTFPLYFLTSVLFVSIDHGRPTSSVLAETSQTRTMGPPLLNLP